MTRPTIITGRYVKASFGCTNITIPFRNYRRFAPMLPTEKKATYKTVAAGYIRFLRHKITIWFQPMRRLWEHKPSGLAVRINPEIGLRIDGTPHVLKLYFCQKPLQKDRVLGIVQLMEATLQPYHTSDTIFGLLDVPNNKLWTTADCKDDLMPSIRGHAMAFMQMYNEL